MSIRGQAVLRMRNYKRTKMYQHLREVKGRNPRVSYYQIVTDGGRILETPTKLHIAICKKEK